MARSAVVVALVVVLAVFVDSAVAKLPLPKLAVKTEKKCMESCSNKCELVTGQHCMDIPMTYTECKPVMVKEMHKKCDAVCKPKCSKACLPLPHLAIGKKGVSLTKATHCKDVCVPDCQHVCKDVEVEVKKIDCKTMTKTEKKCVPTFEKKCKKECKPVCIEVPTAITLAKGH